MVAIAEVATVSDEEVCPGCRGRGISEENPGWCGIEGGGSVLCPVCHGTGRAPTEPTTSSDDAVTTEE